jgi:hypothetical protein
MPAYPCMVYVKYGEKPKYYVVRYSGKREELETPADLKDLLEQCHRTLAERVRSMDDFGEEFDPANQMTVAELSRMFVRNESLEHLFAPEEIFFQPAFKEYVKRALSVPELLISALFRFVTRPLEARIGESVTDLGQAIPTGVFNNDAISEFFGHMFQKEGRTNDFRELQHKLYLVGVDLNTAEPAVFGSEPFAHIPISKAVQASSALPGLYSPVEIEGRHYVGGGCANTPTRRPGGTSSARMN